MIRKLLDLKQEIQRQEAVLDIQRRAFPGRFRDMELRYRRRLSSPTTLLTSLAAGLVVGTLSRRFRRRVKPDSKPAKRSRLALVQAIAGPALIHVLRTKGIQLLENALRR